MRRVPPSFWVAASLALTLVACGIKGSPKPPSAPPAPPAETKPPEEPGQGPFAPSGPTINPAPDAGTLIPGPADSPDSETPTP
ncbi:hypothetical protein ACLESO_38055 [Pyxidicoccus sp. 3LG]